MLHVPAAHEIALEDKVMGICSLVDDSLKVAGKTRGRGGDIEGT